MFSCIAFLILGACIGLLMAALIGAAHHDEFHQDLTAAYRSGFKAGQQHPLPPSGELP